MTDTRDPFRDAAFSSPPQPSGFVIRPDAIPLHGPAYNQRPAELYRQMRREHGPVVPIILEGGVPAWYVIGYRELNQVLDNPELFGRDCRRWNLWDLIPPDWPLMPFAAYQPSLAFTEGAEHKRRAGAVSDALAAMDQFELRADCERIADGLIDAFAGHGTADLISQYSDPMPALALTKMLGIPDDEVPALIQDIATAANSSPESMAAHGRVGATLGRLLASKHQNPGPDVTSRLLAHPAGLTDEEVIQDILVILAAGQQTTGNWIGNTLQLMLTDDRFSVNMSGGRSSAGQALNEVLWEDTPIQNQIGRWATRATQLGGQRIQAGDLLVLGMGAANSDPQVRPDSYAGAAGNHAQMSFNHGEHCCPYPAPELAEIIAKAAVEVVLDRIPDVLLAVPAGALEWRESLWMRGLSALPVQFTPAHVTVSSMR